MRKIRLNLMMPIVILVMMHGGWCGANDDNTYLNGQYDDNFEQNDEYFGDVLNAKNSANDNYFQNEHDYSAMNSNSNNKYSLRNRLLEENRDDYNEYAPRDDRQQANNFDVPFTFSNYRKQQQQQQQQKHYEDDIKFTQDVAVKQGKLRGFVRQMHPQSGLKNVDQYLGIPYAEAPVGSRRFMPPGAPPPWNGVKIATKLPAVCPQLLPNLGNTDNKPSKGRYDQIKRLLPYLKNESEDCLFMNIYIPSWEGIGPQMKYAVVVYIHGESFEWNSGNAYDGSILASYGQVIVITLNYRLGILGFMKPGLSDHTVSNFGLLDQVAALQWVKDNIAAFGGDNKAITLMGHGTGAACVNFLMVSPVAKGLFHRAILMSGSALSDWALTNHPLQATMQIAEGLNCPLTDENEEMLQCLRKKRYSEIFSVKTSAPEFSTRFGPIIDGLVIPNTAHKVMGQYSDIFSRYDLLYGVTELESYHILNAIALNYGLLENERNNLLRFYMQNRFEIRPDLAFASTIKEYSEFFIDPSKAVANDHRDTLLEILSDARVAAPLVQTGLYLSKVNPKCYMYVFSHNSEAGEYARLAQSVVGEELAYVFGAPLGQVGPFQPHYNADERLFSEAIMKYWTNFAKTGNPKAPWRDLFLNQGPKDWEHYDIDWPEFNSVNQSYLHLGITPLVAYRYRNKYMKFWNQELGEKLSKLTTMKNIPPFIIDHNTNDYPGRGTSTNPDMITGHINLYPIKVDIERPLTEDPFRAIKSRIKDPLTGPGMYNAATQSTPPMNFDPNKQSHSKYHTDDDQGQQIAKAESTMAILIGLIIFFLLINIAIIVAYLVKRSMNKGKFGNGKNNDENIMDAVTDEKRSKFNETDDSFIMDIVRKTNNTYEPVKAHHSPINGYTMTRQLSTSTVDAHTKVCDWMSQDILKYSPKPAIKKFHSPISSIKGKSFLQKPKKVSVAIDATPSARSNSILRQEPIEVTKAKCMDYPSNKEVIVCQDVDVSDIDSINTYEVDEEHDIDKSTMPSNEPFVNIYHKHSTSDPVETYNYNVDEKVTSFIEPADINVTSRESPNRATTEMTPEESLRTIQRRNFPKVLPDHPNANSVSNAMKRRSLPPQYIVVPPTNSLTRDFGFRVPPQPPPRTSSTLGRNTSMNRISNSFFTSPLMVAEEPPATEEPIITLNTLHFGPLVPKNVDHASSPKINEHNEQANKDESSSSSSSTGSDNSNDSSSTTTTTSSSSNSSSSSCKSEDKTPKNENKITEEIKVTPNDASKTKRKTGIPLPGSYKYPAIHEDINEKIQITKNPGLPITKTSSPAPSLPNPTSTFTPIATATNADSNISKIPTRDKLKFNGKERDKSSSDSSSTASSTGTVRKNIK